MGILQELAVMLPNRTTLRYVATERDVYLILKLCLPTSMPCSSSDQERYKDMLKDDLIASSLYSLDVGCITVSRRAFRDHSNLLDF